MQPLAEIVRLNTDLLVNCLEGLSDEELWRQAAPAANTAGYLVAHVIDARNHLARTLGRPCETPVTSVIARAATAQDVDRRFTVAELIETWQSVSSCLETCLAEVDGTRLSTASPLLLPIDDASLIGSIAFLVQHDSYHIGQLALIRKHFGHGAMAYTRRR